MNCKSDSSAAVSIPLSYLIFRSEVLHLVSRINSVLIKTPTVKTIFSDLAGTGLLSCPSWNDAAVMDLFAHRYRSCVPVQVIADGADQRTHSV